MKTTSPYPASSAGGEGSPPVRLTELLSSKGAQLSPLERQAGELLSKLSVPAPLPTKALDRIGDALQKAPTKGLGWILGGGAGLVAIVAAGLLVSQLTGRSPSQRAAIPVPVIEQVAARSALPEPAAASPVTAPPDSPRSDGVSTSLTPLDPVRVATRPIKRHAPQTAKSGLEDSAPALVTPPPQPPLEESPLAIESRLLGQALLALRQDRDPKLALQRLDDYASRFPRGSLHDEAQAARVDALILLGKRSDALAVLEKTSFARLPRGGELTVLRGELKAAGGRCRDAMSDFAHIVEGAGTGDVAERALYGQGICRAHLGDLNGATADLRAYISRFPGGRFQNAAEQALRSLSSSSVPTP